MGHTMITTDRVTYAQYKDWPEEERYELINGIAIPFFAPYRLHHDISRALFMRITNYSVGKKFHVYTNPFDVRLFEAGAKEEEIENVVQPDISIFLDESNLDDRGAIGPPDWLIEITSEITFENVITGRRFCISNLK
ncbi:MAG: Uma2 family endonuclease [Bacteroidia bacterium]